MLNNVKDPLFGAKGDGVSDDRAAIQNAITDAALDPEKAGIFFPAGIYRLSRVDVPQSGGCSLELDGVRDFMVMGEGPKSAVRLEDTFDTTSDWHVFLLRNNCQRVGSRGPGVPHQSHERHQGCHHDRHRWIAAAPCIFDGMLNDQASAHRKLVRVAV
jgi:hypothetical protein